LELVRGFTGRELPGTFLAAWRILVPEFTVELAVGDVLLIGNRTLTVIDIEGSEVHFRIDEDVPPHSQASSDGMENPEFRLKAK
jgi:hypothetical protein